LRKERRLRVSENRVLKRIFGPKSDEVRGEWRKLNNEEFNDLYSTSKSLRVIKSRRLRWAGHVERMGKEEFYTGFWWGSLRERDHLEDSGVDGKIILR
jgi:hypothetical protein